MEHQEFDEEFNFITKEMVEIAFEIVSFNTLDIDTVFIIGSYENELIFFNTFYRVNGKITNLNDINKFSKTQFDTSTDRTVSLQRLGNQSLKELINIFKKYERELPTLIKIKFWPKTKNFESVLSYDLQYSDKKGSGFYDVLIGWFEEEKRVK